MASALNFGGDNDYATIPYKSGLFNTKAFTIETWIYPTSSSIIIQDVLSNGTRNLDLGVKFLYKKAILLTYILISSPNVNSKLS